MRYLVAVLAVLCGIVLLLKIATGTMDGSQIAGVGIILLALAFFLPATWPNMPG